MINKRNIENKKSEFKINKLLLPKHMRKTPPMPSDPIPFGAIDTDHMLICDYIPHKNGWQTPEIVPYKPFSLNPSAVVFHYGQTIFEGLKAYRSKDNDDEVFLFRPEKNAQRMRLSALRLGMEPFPEDLFVACVEELIRIERRWILPSPDSLYIRPTMIPLDEGVSYRASKAYRFYIILSPAKCYFANDTGISVYIERNLSRAAVGGSGEAKCGGNYAAALPPMVKAKQNGAEQVLWLDSSEHKYVEEAGAMNVMFIYGNKIVTPALSGSILQGVTRASILELAKDLGYEVEERKVEISEVIKDIKAKKLTEMFACGTAAVISPINALIEDGEKITINNGKIGEITIKLKENLLGIQTGSLKDPYGWRVPVI
ncbi:branched-chain amino acid aminotransferase [Fluviispira vulneris]|uniref:branched-chain amino acid aminotransferase n=1 Tax=Fluviispira vulneris TaxID=2763012 RepID=UPI0016452C5C|nr:branched-chain amino acid aminotransferase [Fluviispira vulneris]